MSKTATPLQLDAPAPRAPAGTIERMRRDQGVIPLKSLDEFSALWPEGDDPDALLEFILEERRERRAIVKPEL